MLRLLLFGFPTISLSDEPIRDFISQKSIVLFCYLALEKRVHAREELAGLFWTDMPQERAMSNLRQALHNLQKLLPDYMIVTRLTAEFNHHSAYISDCMAFHQEHLIGTEALNLYQADFMAGININDDAEIAYWIETKREFYKLRFMNVLENSMIMAFNHRDIPFTKQFAQQLIKHNPYHELGHHILWRILIYQGHFTETIANIDDYRQLLQDELDVPFTEETQRISQQIRLAHHAKRHNIPDTVSPFVGRDAEIAKIQQLFQKSECSLVTITGIGGAGKSRLAQEFGRSEVGYYLNGVAYIPLTIISDMVYFQSALAQALDLSIQNSHDPQQEIESFLAPREMLLIFDNAEHLPSFANQIVRLLSVAPFVNILVTSRHKLNIREEWVISLAGLPINQGISSASVKLLAEIAQQNGQQINHDEYAVMLCEILQGLPLGIEIAGTMLTTDNIRDILNAVQQNLDYLQSQWINVPTHHKNLRAVFQTTWDKLETEEQTALTALTIFDSPFTSDSALAIAQTTPQHLNNLASWSLIFEQDHHWDMHAVIQTYAHEYQIDDAQVRFRQYYLRIIEKSETAFTARHIPEAIQIIKYEINGIRQFWEMLIDDRTIPLLIRVLYTLHRFYEGTGWYVEGLALFRKSMDRLKLDGLIPEERQLSGRLKMHIAGILLRLGQVSDAHLMAQDAVDNLQSDRIGLAFALNTLGIAQLYRGEMETACQTLEQCANIYRQLEMPELLKPLINLGGIYNRLGDGQKARTLFQEAHEIAHDIQDVMGEFHITNALGVNHMLDSDYDNARHYIERALELSTQAGFLSGRTIALSNLGDIHILLGDAPAGVQYAQEAIHLAHEIEDRRALIYGLSTLTLAQIALNQPESMNTLKECAQLAITQNNDPMIAVTLYACSMWYQANDKYDEAKKLWQVIANHPAVEMDYKRRAIQHLKDHNEKALTDNTPLFGLLTRFLSNLN